MRGRRFFFEPLELRVLLDGKVFVPDFDPPADVGLPVPGVLHSKIGVSGDLEYEARTLYVTADGAPTGGTHTTSPGVSEFGVNVDGVADLIIDNQFRCTGSLLSTGMHILTAAHCVTDSLGNPIASQIDATWTLTSGNVIASSTVYDVHPSFDGDFLHGHDIAVLTLPAAVSSSVPRYELYRDGASELNLPGVKVGVGRSGHGDTGDLILSGAKRAGKNLWDSDASVFSSVGAANVGTQLIYDFDNGLPANDAFDFFYGISELGFGVDEVGSAPGDSGGPTFVEVGGSFKIAGVTSYGITLRRRIGPPPKSSDVDNTLNSTFGEFAGDARVKALLPFIDGILFSDNNPPSAVNDAATTDEDTAVVIDVLANDSDPDGDPLLVSAVTQGSSGSVVINPDNTVTYTPVSNFNGDDSFTYTASDGGSTDTATVSVTINPLPDPPQAVDDMATTDGSAVEIDVLANDSDPDGDPLDIIGFTDGLQGTVKINDGNPDTVTYTPVSGFANSDTFTYTISDGDGGTDTATVTVSLASPGLHVGNLSGEGIKLSKGFWKGVVTITVHDSSENPVASATVMGTFTQNGSAIPASCVTAATGTCIADSGQLPSKNGSATYTVDDITHATLLYNASDNHDPDGGNGTSIDLSKGGTTTSSNSNADSLATSESNESVGSTAMPLVADSPRDTGPLFGPTQVPLANITQSTVESLGAVLSKKAVTESAVDEAIAALFNDE